VELVPFVEAGEQMSPACLTVLQAMFTACRGSACGFFGVRLYSLSVLNEATHLFGQKLTLIDSGLAVARQTARILIKNELLFDEIRQNHLQLSVLSAEIMQMS
jgi:glutamate racemase